MTNPRDDIAGLIEDMQTWGYADLSFLDGDIPTQMQASCREAATQLAALSARVKELEDQVFEFQHGVDAEYRNGLRIEAESRATRLQQERDELRDAINSRLP